MNPVAVQICDSIRPYGLGVLSSLIAFGLFWLVTTAPNAKNIALATIVGVLSAHCVYQKAPILLAIGLGSIAVCIRRGLWKRTFIIYGIGLVVFLTLLPYLSLLEQVRDWAILNKMPVTTGAMTDAAAEAFGSLRIEMIWIWIIIIATSILMSLAVLVRARKDVDRQEAAASDLVLYAIIVLVFSALGCLMFLAVMGIYPFFWHFVSLIGLLALCIEVIVDQWKRAF